MQPPSRHWALGFTLALGVAALWGVLPIGLKVALSRIDAWTITWWRFAGAAVVLGAWLSFRGEFPLKLLGDRSSYLRLILTTLFLAGNYILYIVGLDRTSPAVAQTVIQLAPLLLVVFGVVLFHEPFSRRQWTGFAVLGAGLALFFNHRLPELLHPTLGWGLGVFLVAGGAVSWAAYGVGQKQLLRKYSSAQTLLVIYVIAAVLLAPLARPASVLTLDRAGVIALLFSIANTVVAYGAFGLALEVWDVSRVSSIVSAAPLFTLAATALMARLGVGWIVPEVLNTLSIGGALAVVAGSAISALGGKK